MNFWTVLDLAPGQDAAAIKKAYVLKLRTTRPDDDAAAYQQLREAYDAALAWVKRAPETAAAEPQGQAAQAHAPANALDLGDLVNTVLDLWEEQGDAALLAYWPQLKNVLNESPLAQAIPCSTAFARMVLSESRLAPEFVDQLRLYFGWGIDFRRTPQLAGYDAVEFKRRLAHLAQQIEQKKLKQEQDLQDAVTAAQR
jgi:hypothetical protein